ncbi:MAG: hypothetical protein IT308_05940 [Anaerolineaceae bacterium]|nr:hypothetical protein [Anaerolineaceae bacterium]
MNHPKFTRVVALAALLAFTSLACAVTGILPTKETPAATALPPELPPTPESAKLEGLSFFLLNDLESYRGVLNLTLQGQNQTGESVTRSLELVNETIKSQNARHVSVRGDAINPGSDNTPSELFVLGQKAYIFTPVSSAKPCFILSADPINFTHTSYEEFTDLFARLTTGDLIAKGEEVNNTPSDHFVLSAAQMLFGTPASQQGEIWLAQDGGYPVRFTGQAEGTFSLSSETITGTAQWEYNLLEVNQLGSIELPQACLDEESISTDIPILPDAGDQTTYGGTISYNSPTAPAAAANFYRTELPANGWEIINETASPPVFILLARKGERSLQVNIGPGLQSGTTILITPGL